ncbi:MAG: AMIN domain-containing protein [Desulfovibrio sp.]|nr:AMIN domain-containing protein [Desulfovibrio sp.]
MNKALLSILLAVCILGMALIMLNERLHGDKSQAATPSLVQPIQTASVSSGTVQRTIPVGADVNTSQDHLIQEVRATATQKELRPPESKENVKKNEVVKKELVEKKVKPVQREERTVAEVRPVKEEPKKVEKDRDVKKVLPEKGEKVIDKKQEAKVKRLMKKFVVFSREKGATVRLNGNSDMQYKTSQMHAPERFLVELDGEWDMDVPKIPNNPLVGQIRVSTRNKKTRLVLDLKDVPRICRVVVKDKQNIDIRVDK